MYLFKENLMQLYQCQVIFDKVIPFDILSACVCVYMYFLPTTALIWTLSYIKIINAFAIPLSSVINRIFMNYMCRSLDVT